jgi:MFS family permease
VGLLVSAGAIWMIWNLNYITFISFAPLLLIAGGRSISEAGLAVSLVSWLSLAFVPLGGWLIDRTGRANLLMTGAMLGTAALTVLLAPGRWAVPLILAMGVVRGPVAGGINALPSEVVGPRHRSTGFGIYFTVYYLGMALLPPVAGWLQDRAGTPVAPVLFAAGCAVLCVPALAVFRGLQRRWTPGESPGVAPQPAR